jgi:hypothetical protein
VDNKRRHRSLHLSNRASSIGGGGGVGLLAQVEFSCGSRSRGSVPLTCHAVTH